MQGAHLITASFILALWHNFCFTALHTYEGGIIYKMTKWLTFLPMLLGLLLILAACGPADTEAGDVTPGVVTPNTIATPVDSMNTPVVPVAPETTVEVTPPATPETTPTVVDDAPALEGSQAENPYQARNMLDLDLRNYEDETIGSIEELIISLDQLPEQTNQQQEPPTSSDLNKGDGAYLSYLIVNVGGFLGIGQRQVAIPYESVELQTGEDENDYAFYIDINQEELEALPEVDLDQLEFTGPDWDLPLQISLEEEAEASDVQPTPTSFSPSATTADSLDDNEQAGILIYALRVSSLLGAEVYDQEATAPQRSGLTPSPDAEETPTPDTTDTPTTTGTVLDREMVVAIIEDLIIDPGDGIVEYAILGVDDNLELGERWIPVPLHGLIILGADDLLLGVGIEYLIQVDRQRFAQAPSFEVGDLPVRDDPDWDTGVREYWGVQ
jgi:hypothetical protein